MIGCDIVKIDRFNELIQKPQFLKKYFTNLEIEYVNSKQNKCQTMAGIFACKEAFLKALKLGIGNGLRLNQIEVSHSPTGAPQIVFTPEIDYFLSMQNLTRVDLSISHDGNYAFSVCEVL